MRKKDNFDLWILVLFFLMLYISADSKPKDVTMSVIEDCIFKELRDCGDKLCEMSYTSNYPIVEQAFENLKQCIDKAVK